MRVFARFLALYAVMMLIAMPLSAPIGLFITFMTVWGACFFLYFVASIWVMMTRPLTGRWLWVELGLIFGGAMTSVFSVTRLLEMAAAGITVLVICIQRLRKRMSVEAALFLLITVALMVYAHVFPWYMTALLPWIAIVAVPVWTRERGVSTKGLAVVMVWYFTCTAVLSYIPGLDQYSTVSNWLIYYGVSFGVMVVGLAVAAVIGFMQHRSDFEAASPSTNSQTLPKRYVWLTLASIRCNLRSPGSPVRRGKRGHWLRGRP